MGRGGTGRYLFIDGPYRRLRWRRGGSGPPMRTVSPAPVAERRIGSSNADRIAGSGGGEADRVLQCGPSRRRWCQRTRPDLPPGPPAGATALSRPGSRGGLSPPPSSMLCALLAERRHRGPAAEASASPDAVCRTVHAIQRRPWPPTLAARQPRGLSSWSAGLGVLARFARAAAGRGGGWRVGAVVAGGLRSIGNGYGYVHGNGTVASRRGVPLFVVKNPGEESP
jgi:hypothetical protein